MFWWSQSTPSHKAITRERRHPSGAFGRTERIYWRQCNDARNLGGRPVCKFLRFWLYVWIYKCTFEDICTDVNNQLFMGQAVVGCGYPGRQEGVRVLIVDSSSDQNVKISRDCLVGEIWVDSPSKVCLYLYTLILMSAACHVWSRYLLLYLLFIMFFQALGYWANEEQSNIDFKAMLSHATDTADKDSSKSGIDLSRTIFHFSTTLSTVLVLT